jgi:hypothetical protein
MKGILFKEELFQAVRNGEKTETRRVVKDVESNIFLPLIFEEEVLFYQSPSPGPIPTEVIKKPRYKPGEIVYLKEPFFQIGPEKYVYLYGEDKNALPRGSWKNKLFMPEAAARFFIEVIDWDLQRIKEITEESAINEGCKGVVCGCNGGAFGCENCMNTGFQFDPISEFFGLWDKINKPPYSVEDNSFVFTYRFKLLPR